MAAIPSQPDMVFADSNLAQQYATYRPQPPESLVNRVVHFWRQGKDRSPHGEVTGDTLVVDVGCGSGQSTHQFAAHFDKVIGVDVSPDQLAEARNLYKDLNNVTFLEGDAEHLPFSPASVDMITVCTAVHWFDLPAFYSQVDRVLRPGGVLAVYCYLNGSPLYKETCLRDCLMKVWDGLNFDTPNSEHLMAEYATLPSAYEEDVYISSDAGNFEVSSETDLDSLMGFIWSWSPVAKYRKKYGEPALQQYMKEVRQKFIAAMKTTEENPNLVQRFRYFLRMWRKPIVT